MAISRLVIAKYQEDDSWTERLPGHMEVNIIQKGVHLPNEGREAASYLWAFQNLEYEDDDLLFCVQGDPFVHCPTLVRHLYESPDRFFPLGNWRVECDGEGKPHHPGLPVRTSYEEWFGKEFPGSVSFTAGGQFVITGKEAKSIDHSKWYERSCTEHGPWLMERYWEEIFAEA